MYTTARDRLVRRRGHSRRPVRAMSSNGRKPFKARERACDLYAGLYRWMGNTCPRCGAAKLPRPHRHGLVERLPWPQRRGPPKALRHAAPKGSQPGRRNPPLHSRESVSNPPKHDNAALRGFAGLCDTTEPRNRPVPLPAASRSTRGRSLRAERCRTVLFLQFNSFNFNNLQKLLLQQISLATHLATHQPYNGFRHIYQPTME